LRREESLSIRSAEGFQCLKGIWAIIIEVEEFCQISIGGEIVVIAARHSITYDDRAAAASRSGCHDQRTKLDRPVGAGGRWGRSGDRPGEVGFGVANWVGVARGDREEPSRH
jgi:hypothetical protein